MSHSEHLLVVFDLPSCDYPQSSHWGSKNGAPANQTLCEALRSQCGTGAWTYMPAAWTVLCPYQRHGFNMEKCSEYFLSPVHGSLGVSHPLTPRLSVRALGYCQIRTFHSIHHRKVIIVLGQ